MKAFIALFQLLVNILGRNAMAKVESYTTSEHIIETVDGHVVEERVEKITVVYTTKVYAVKNLYIRSKGNHILEGDEFAHMTEAQMREDNRNTFEFTCCGSRFWREATKAEADAAGFEERITFSKKMTYTETLNVAHLHIVKAERDATAEEIELYTMNKQAVKPLFMEGLKPVSGHWADEGYINF